MTSSKRDDVAQIVAGRVRAENVRLTVHAREKMRQQQIMVPEVEDVDAMTRSTIEEETDHSLGFPVVIRNSPRRETEDGRTVFDVPLGEYQHAALVELVRTPYPWTGSHVEFVRKWLRESMDTFGARADVSNPAVCKWEQKGDSATGMTKGTEYLLRVQVAHELRENDIIDAGTFQRLVMDAMKFDRDREPAPIELDGRDLVGEDWGDGTAERNAATG